MGNAFRVRRVIVGIVSLVCLAIVIAQSPDSWQSAPVTSPVSSEVETGQASEILAQLPVKGRAPKTGYTRTQFGDGWAMKMGCDMRNIILNRDMRDVVIGDGCKVLSGLFTDPYTGSVMQFTRGVNTSADVQIDHVVALSNAWQTGAQQLTPDQRAALANDPLELLASSDKANQEKSDGDAASWLPSNKVFRCQYIARQIAVKQKYMLWVTPAERDAMNTVLIKCPGQLLPKE
ncbi:HNH endonuclease [bacterium]|nr:MAG: HNH endonuclease [bacterium]